MRFWFSYSAALGYLCVPYASRSSVSPWKRPTPSSSSPRSHVVKRSESPPSAKTHEMSELRAALCVCERGPVLKGKLNSAALYVVVGCADGCTDGWPEGRPDGWLVGVAEGTDVGCPEGWPVGLHVKGLSGNGYR